LGAPDYERALQQHAAYCEALERCGLELIFLEADERYPDSTFVEDTSVLVPAGAILTRPGAASRLGEVESIKETVARLCSRVDSIQEPGTLDGGDVCEAGNHFFIGLSERTNEAGAGRLAELLTSYGYTSSFVDIRNMKDILHLKSGLASLGDNRLVIIEALANREEFRGYELVRVNVDEEYAANCVRVNDYVLVAAGYPVFEQMLRGLGYETISLEMTEFQKMDGGLSCLSLRF
jgi:dimethylargininase